MDRKRILTAALLVAAQALLPTGPAMAETNRIVLRVNDRIATLYDYEKLKLDRIRNLARSNLSEEERQQLMAQVGPETMRALFEEMLLLSRADQLSIRIPPSELQAALERTKESFGIRTDEEYEEALRQSGMTRDALRQQIENGMRMREVFGIEVYSDIAVEEEDLRRYYGNHPEEFRTQAALQLREVVVLESSTLDSSERSELAQRLREAIAAGEAEALLMESEAAGSTTGWIDLGWVQVGDLDPQLEGAVEKLEAGQVSEATAARGGLHLLQLVERRDARLREFSEVRQELAAAERDRRFQKKQAEYMSRLEKTAFIVSNPPPEAADYRRQGGDAPSPSDGLAPVSEPTESTAAESG